MTSATALDDELDKLDKAKNGEQDSRKSENAILEDIGFRLEPKEVGGGDPGSDATGIHPLLVARDGSTLKGKKSL